MAEGFNFQILQQGSVAPLRTHVQTKKARRADYQYVNGDSKRQIANPPIDNPKPGTENPTPPTEHPNPPTENPKLRPPLLKNLNIKSFSLFFL